MKAMLSLPHPNSAPEQEIWKNSKDLRKALAQVPASQREATNRLMETLPLESSHCHDPQFPHSLTAQKTISALDLAAGSTPQSGPAGESGPDRIPFAWSYPENCLRCRSGKEDQQRAPWVNSENRTVLVL